MYCNHDVNDFLQLMNTSFNPNIFQAFSHHQTQLFLTAIIGIGIEGRCRQIMLLCQLLQMGASDKERPLCLETQRTLTLYETV